MALRLEGKKAIVADVAEMAKHATSIIAANYTGLTVGQLTELRKATREVGAQMRVVRNTLARRAFEGTKFACMQKELVGPLVLVFSTDEPSTAARTIKDFVKKCDKFEVKMLSMDGKLLPAIALNVLSSLPTRNEAIAQLMAVIVAPVTKLVRTLAEPHGKLVRTIAAIRDKKQQAA